MNKLVLTAPTQSWLLQKLQCLLMGHDWHIMFSRFEAPASPACVSRGPVEYRESICQRCGKFQQIRGD